MRRHIHFLGGANAQKPKIIIELLSQTDFFDKYDCTVILDKEEGCLVNTCDALEIKTLKISDLKNDEDYKLLKVNSAEMLVSIGWDRLIPERVLNLYDCSLNCHGGYLPDYKGSRAYMAVYANCEEFYGATIHYMTKEFDKGNIIKQLKIKYFPEETPLILHYRLCELCAFMLPEAVEKAFNGYAGIQQKGPSRYFYKMTRDEMIMLHEENLKRMAHSEEKLIAKHK